MDRSRPDQLADNMLMIRHLLELEDVHQHIIWQIYWEGISMRALAKEWAVDELVIIREHSALLEFINKLISKKHISKKIKIRPGFKSIAIKLSKIGTAPFDKLVSGELF